MTTRLVRVLGEDELEGDVRTTEAACSVDPRRQPEADRSGVDGGRIDVRAPHERLQPRTRRRGEDPKTCGCERAVLVNQRNDVGDRGQRDEVETALDCRVVGTEKRRAELVDDARPAELGEGICRRARRDDRAVRQHLSRSMVVRDDDVEPALPGLGDLLDGRDPAVDGEDEADAVVREARQRLPRDAVAFLEPARQVPHDVGAELPEKEDGQRRRADAVDVVVAVYADPNPLRDGGADPADGHAPCLRARPGRRRGFSASRNRRAASGSS